ncbi:hypothetical protein Tco_1457796 [Tanacetum coccineum]
MKHNFNSINENPFFNEMEEDVENENSKVFDEPVLPHTPFSNKVECFNPGGDNDEIDAFLAIEVPIHIEGYFDSEIPPGVESDFDSEEDIIDNLLNNDSTHERLTFNIEPDAPVINNVVELNEDECFDPGGGEINDEVDNSFTFVTYPEVSPLLSSTKNEDTIFDPGIST